MRRDCEEGTRRAVRSGRSFYECLAVKVEKRDGQKNKVLKTLCQKNSLQKNATTMSTPKLIQRYVK